MPPRAVPPPPRPEPVTLDQIYDQLTRTEAGMDSKAYHLVALNTVAFNPSVKLYFYEHYQQRARSALTADVTADRPSTPSQAVLDADRARRESLLKAIAFFLAQRLHPVSLECRWETVSLLGELCRMEDTHKNAPTTPQGQLEAKLNEYAKLNLEYLACSLPWFLPAVKAIMGEEALAEAMAATAPAAGTDDDDGKTDSTGSGAKKPGGDDKALTAHSSTEKAGGEDSRAAIRDRLRARRQQLRSDGRSDHHTDSGDAQVDEDEDALIAIGDIVRALPLPREGTTEPFWNARRLEQARDLMFLDASTSMLHLIPTVSRSLSHTCAQCGKVSTADTASTTTTTAATPAFLRCSSCKAVYYCSAACQREHWSTAHRSPCKAYKDKVELTAAQYDAMNGRGGKGKSKKTTDGVAVLEVPLEPTLFFETRRYLFDHRDASFGNVDFNNYFMSFTVRGT